MKRMLGFIPIFRTGIILFFALILFGPGGGEAQAAEWTGNINGFFGAKEMDSFWRPADEHIELGLQADFRRADWPVNIAIDILRSSDESSGSVFGMPYDLEVTTTEFNFGVRKIWDFDREIHPFIGGGLSFIHLEADIDYKFGGSRSDSELGVGAWVGGGAYVRLMENFNLGFETKFSDAKVDFFGHDVNAGGLHFGVIAGYHW